MNDVKQFRVTPRWHWALSKKNAKSGFAAVHYAAIESKRELDKSFAHFWSNYDNSFFDLCKTVDIFQEK